MDYRLVSPLAITEGPLAITEDPQRGLFVHTIMEHTFKILKCLATSSRSILNLFLLGVPVRQTRQSSIEKLQSTNYKDDCLSKSVSMQLFM